MKALEQDRHLALRSVDTEKVQLAREVQAEKDREIRDTGAFHNS